MINPFKHFISILSVIVFLFLAIGSDSDNESSSQNLSETLPPPPPMTRKDSIELQFSAWDGSHYTLERLVKSSIRDPDSYQHIKTLWWDTPNGIIVSTRFRSKNGFGGYSVSYVKAKVNIKGDVVKIIDSSEQ